MKKLFAAVAALLMLAAAVATPAAAQQEFALGNAYALVPQDMENRLTNLRGILTGTIGEVREGTSNNGVRKVDVYINAPGNQGQWFLVLPAWSDLRPFGIRSNMFCVGCPITVLAGATSGVPGDTAFFHTGQGGWPVSLPAYGVIIRTGSDSDDIIRIGYIEGLRDP